MGELKPIAELSMPSPQGGGAAPGAPAVSGTGQKVENCGLTEKCGADSIAVHMFSGKENVNGPRLCIQDT